MSRAPFPPVLRRGFTLFAAIGAALTVVLVPMVLLYEHSRRETLKTRVDAVMDASALVVGQVFQETLGDSAVVLSQPVLDELVSSPRPTEAERRRVLGLFQSVMDEYERYASIRVVANSGDVLLGLDRFPPPQAPAPTATWLPAEARAAAQRLRPGQLWFSPVFWPSAPEAFGLRQAEPCVLLLRPLFSRSGGSRQGVLAFVIRLGPLVGDFDRITNGPDALQRGYLLSWNGRVINAAGGGQAVDFAARHPEVWKHILQRGSGVVETTGGLFLFLSDNALPWKQAQAAGLFLFRQLRPHSPSAAAGAEASSGSGFRLVVQVPTSALYRSSAFSQPVGISLVVLLYLLAAATSVAIAYAQERLALLRQQEQEQQERQQAVMDNAGVGMAICDPVSGRIRSANGALCTFVGRTEAELRQTTWEDLSYAEDRQLDQTQAAQLREGNLDHYRVRRRFLSADGTLRTGDQVITATRNARGVLLDLIVQIIDSTELVTKTAYLEAASIAGIVGLWDLDLRRNVMSWDPVMHQLYGRPRDEHPITLDSWKQAVHPEDKPSVLQALQTALEGGQPFDCPFRVVWPDRSVHHIQARGRIQFDSDGQALRMIGVSYDITEQVQRSAYIEAAASAGIIGVWDWDIAHDVLTWDPVMYALYGLRAEDFQGTRDAWARAVHPEDQAFVLQELNAGQQGWREYRPQFRVVWPDGSVHHIQARSRTTFSSDGRAERMIGVNYDVTAQVERQAELDEQRALLAATMEALVDPLVQLSTGLVITDLNSAAARFFGRSKAQLLGKPLEALVPAAAPDAALWKAIEAVIDSGEPFLANESPLLSAPLPPERFVDLRAVKVPAGVVLSFSDVSERREAAARLAASEEGYRLLAMNSTDVVIRLRDDINIWTSPSVTEMFGWRPKDWVGHHTAEFLHPDDMEGYRTSVEAMERGGRIRTRSRLLARDGTWHWIEVHAGPYRDEQGRIDGQVVSFRTIDREVAAEQQLERQARTDELTGLLNRREVVQRIDRLTAPEQRTGQQTGLLFCDLDRFKEINDRYGHGVGDRVLRTVAERIRRCLRQQDLAARVGGDELLVVLLGVQDLENAVAIAEKIRTVVMEPVLTPAGEVEISLSIGVTVAGPGESSDALIARADAAMYDAKRFGRNRVVPITVGPG